jgi:hypothetical protein
MARNIIRGHGAAMEYALAALNGIMKKYQAPR